MTAAAWLREWRAGARVYADPRVVAILALGFSSGLPIMLVASTLSTWLAEEGVSKASIGLFAYVLAPYTFKFAWAPLVDRLPLPPFTTLLGRRRGWMLATQIGLILSIWALGQTDPGSNLYWTAVWAVLVAFFSATQDIVIDAYRIEILPTEKLGAGAGVVVLGYRCAMWVATAGALLIADAAGWSTAYASMALLMLVGVTTALLVREPEISIPALAVRPREPETERNPRPSAPATAALTLGPALILAILHLGLIEPISAAAALALGLFGGAGLLGSLVVAAELMLAAFGLHSGIALLRRRPDGLRRLQDWALWALICAILEVLAWLLFADAPYLAEAYAWLAMQLVWVIASGAASIATGSALAPDAFLSPIWLVTMSFWLRFAGAVYLYSVACFDRQACLLFDQPAVAAEPPLHRWVRQAVVEPFYEFVCRHGAVIALATLALISLFKASDMLLTLMANPFYIEMGFSKTQIAWVSKTFGLWMTLLGGLIGGVVVFRLGLMRSLALAAVVMAISNLAFLLLAYSHDMGLGTPGEEQGQGPLMLALFHLVILIENLSGGLGTSVFVAYLSSLCNFHYTAVQYALLTSFMQLFGKFVLVPSSGFFVDAFGWTNFFIVSSLFALPVLLLIRWLKRRGMAVEVAAPAAAQAPQP